jgi:coiled-coil domain-containing protein 39
MDEFDVLGEQENVSPNELAGGEQGEEMVGPYGSVDMMEGGIGLNMDENEMGIPDEMAELEGAGSVGDDSQLPGVDDLPLFAGPEARKLHLAIKEKEENIEIVSDETGDLAERVKVMKEHFKNVQQELEHTNALQGSKLKEIHTEKHLKQLTSRSLGGHKLEAKRIETELERVQDALNNVQNQIFGANQKLDEFKMQMNWNQEELEQWSLAAKQKEEDMLALEKYQRADEFKIKELNLKLEQLTNELNKKRSSLDNWVANTEAKQKELDRVAKDFDALHVERQDMVVRWQETIAEMKKRDEAINELGNAMAVAKKARLEKEKQVAIQQKRLDAQLYENNEVTQRGEVLSRLVSRRREEMMNMTTKIADFRDELESLKNELTSAAESLVTKRATNANKIKDLEERKVTLERQRLKYQQIKAQVEVEKQGARGAEETAKEAEQKLAESEKSYNKSLLKVKELKESLLKETQIVYDVKRTESQMRQTIHGNKAASKNLENKLSQLDKEAARQQELLYNAEFQIQQIERKISRGMGERSDEEKRELRGNIEELEAKAEAIKDKRKMLQGQVRKLTNELVNTRNKKDAQQKRKIELDEKQAEMVLENRMLEDEIKQDTKVKEDQAVSNDLLRLEVRRLRDLLSAKADAVFSLENRRQQLILSMEERKEDIQVHRDMLKAELRVLEDEKHKVTMDLRDKEQNVERLRSRFAAQNTSSKDGEEHSQAYYVIQAAQKREELQRHGDELDHDIRRFEREIRALQTTLDHLNARNVAYRASFQKVDIKGSDVEVLKQMQERTKMAKDMLFRKKKELQRLMTDFEEDSRRLDGLKTQNDRVNKQKAHLESAVVQVEEELLSQDALLTELQERVVRVTNRHRTQAAEEAGVSVEMLDQGTLEEKASRAEVVKDVVQNVLYTLGQLSLEFPEVSDQLNSRMAEAGLRMPSKPPASRAASSRGASRGNGAPNPPRSSENTAPPSAPLAPRQFEIPVE